MIARLFAKGHLGIALIQESWINAAGHIKGLSFVTCIPIRVNFNYTYVSEFMNLALTPMMIQITFEGSIRDFVIASAYFAGAITAPAEVQKLIR